MSIEPSDFPAIPDAIRDGIIERISSIAPYPKFLGLVMEDVRKDYARMRLPYRPELNQPAGIVHGGAIASLVDTVVVGAIFSNADPMPSVLLTIDMHLHYLDAAVEQDVVAHAAVRRRGYRMVYLEVDAVVSGGTVVAHGELAYMLKYPN